MYNSVGILLALIYMFFHSIANACPENHKVFNGDCVEIKDIPKTVEDHLAYYGDKVTQPGQKADLFATAVHLYSKANYKSTIIYKLNPSADIDAEALIKNATGDFYFVTLFVYDSPNSCGNQGKIKKKLHGYIPKHNRQGIPSLWKFNHMTGLC